MTVQREPPRTAFDYYERSWRPSLAWVLILLVMVPVGIFVCVILAAIAYGVAKAMLTGEAVPDITGGLDRILAPAWPYIAAGIGALFTLMVSRHREVNTQLGGGHNRPPFDPSSAPPSASAPPDPSPTGGLVNNDAIQ